MKLKLLFGILLVVGMIGLGSAAEEKETNYSRMLTSEEVNEMYTTWIMPDHMLAEFEKETPELIERKTADMIKKPFTPEEIAEINAKAPEGMFLVTGIEDVTIQKELSISTQMQDVKVKGDEIIMEWPDSDKLSSVISVQNFTEIYVPPVTVKGATCDWKWVQNESAPNQITIKNEGTLAADGFVLIYSYEDSYGWAKSYFNLAPGQEATLSIPFYVDKNLYTTVGAKSITIRNYVVISGSTYLTSAPTVNSIFVEVYNNNDGYLEDPGNGINLELNDLYHHNLYDISVKAAIAGDNSSTPLDTGEAIHSNVYSEMTYNVSVLDSTLTGADRWIIDNGFEGICDEYAVLNGVYLKSLGVPTRQIACNINDSGILIGHQFNELWNGNEWIHSDAKGVNGYSNPKIYVNQGNSVENIAFVLDPADSRSNLDGPDDDYILHISDSLYFLHPELLPKYN